MITTLLIFLGIGVLVYIFYPLIFSSSQSFPEEHGANGEDDLQLKKDTIYRDILDLDFEYSMGRITEEDYQKLRGEYKRSASQLLEKIDLMEKGEIDFDQWIERAVQLYGQNGGNVDIGISQKTCSKCRTENNNDNKFCTQCGSPFQ